MALFALVALALTSLAFSEISATSNTALESSDGAYKLQWRYNNSQLIFTLTCKTTGYNAVAFSETADGQNMVKYDIAVTGYASGVGYVDDYWSQGPGLPTKDVAQDYKLISASEAGGKTTVEFCRDAETGDVKDVQFNNTTEVKVIFASKANSDANNNRLSKHDKTKILDGKYNLISLAMEPPPLPSKTTIQPSATTMSTKESLASTKESVAPTKESVTPTKESVAPTTPMAPPKYASVMSPDGLFKLEWTYSNSKLMFKMTCKTTGWCAVGFTTTPDGRGMKNYDIAVAGFASNAGYIGDYWSTSLSKPPKDPKQSFFLTKASERDGRTMVEFYRDAETGDTANDEQFQSDTEVTIVWASRGTDANVDLSKHTVTGVLSGKHNMIKEAMAAKTGTSPTKPNASHEIFPSITIFLAGMSAYFLAF